METELTNLSTFSVYMYGVKDTLWTIIYIHYLIVLRVLPFFWRVVQFIVYIIMILTEANGEGTPGRLANIQEDSENGSSADKVDKFNFQY